MKTRGKTTIPARLVRARRRFERWRKRRKARSPIPPGLWSLATRTAVECGVSRTARVLSVSYYVLKKRVADASRQADIEKKAHGNGQGGSQSPFVELISSKVWPPPECVVELEDIGGAKMRIQLKAADAGDLVVLSRSFWRDRE